MQERFTIAIAIATRFAVRSKDSLAEVLALLRGGFYMPDSLRSTRNTVHDNDIEAGIVSTQQVAMAARVRVCSPPRVSAMLPATADERMWVVLTGIPKPSARRIVAIVTDWATAP